MRFIATYVTFIYLMMGILPIGVWADPVVFFDTIPDGRDTFDTQISDAGGTQTNDALSGLTNNTNTWDRTDYIITSTNAANRAVSSVALATPAPGGIPGGDAISMNADGSITSGLTFTFSSPINGFAIDLQGWATCCWPSTLYISFDGGTPIPVGTANTNTDNPGFSELGAYETFIGTIDDSATFTTVTLYGTGTGDAMLAGGIIRYAVVPIGAISGNYTLTVETQPVSGLAEYLDENDDSGTLQTVAIVLNTYTASQVASAMRQIFPVNTVSSVQTAVGNVRSASSIVNDRIGTVLGGLNAASSLQPTNTQGPFSGAISGSDFKTMMYAFSKADYQPFTKGDSGLWIQGVYGKSNGDATEVSNGYETERYGLLAGYEFALDEKHLIGVYANSLFTDVGLDNNVGETEIKNYILGLYGQKIIGSYKLAATLGGGIAQYDSVRHVSIGGISGNPEADYDGANFSATLSGSKLFEIRPGLMIEPFLQIGYLYNETDEYTETQGDPYNMSVESCSYAQMNVKAAFTLKNNFTIGEKSGSFKLRPYVNQLLEVSGDDDIGVRFVGSPSQTVITGRDASITEVGGTLELACDLTSSFSVKGIIDYSEDKYEKGYLGFFGFNYSWN
ncbi:MAG: autotransporter domain-containing protein [Desulfobacter sp.]|nr:MAG: autotransporter domain-containing protein [Desulfobacter sp.]